MALRYTSYPIAARGLATAFTEAELPDSFATRFTNRFINAAGGAEKRQGIVRAFDTVPGAPEITGTHEMMLGTESILFASAEGKIHKCNSDNSWTTVYVSGNPDYVYRSEQMGTKLIFYNGIDRSIYTEDGTTFKELKSIIERGTADGGTSGTGLVETDISNWIEKSQVKVNDLVYNYNQNAHGIITVVATTSVTHTLIGTSAVGIGIAGSANSKAGDAYEIIDLVELNVIPTGIDSDNVAICGNDSASYISVSAVTDWTETELRAGDYIRNTTKGWITQVTALSTTALYIVRATASAGDSLIFMKSAQPITNRMHVHFGRTYSVDARNPRRAVVSGPDNPEDMTTDAGDLDSTSLDFGSYQPTADRLVAFTTFQRFLAICGLRNVFLFDGTTPIVDATTKSADFTPVGVFPQGVVNGDSAISIGNDLAYISTDGIQSIAMRYDASSLGNDNLSEPLRNELREAIANTDPSEILLFHYPKRSWLCAKIGSKLYIYNYTPYFGQGGAQGTQFPTAKGSWSVFTGLFAQQRVYMVLSDGTLICAGANGRVYKFDQGTYDDDGTTYNTQYRTGWLSMTPGKRSPQMKQGRYIQPIFDCGHSITYTITAEAPFSTEARDNQNATITPGANTIGTAVVGTARIGGTNIVDQKLSLRWRGKECRFTFDTSDTYGPDTLSRFIVFFTEHGAR